MTLSESLTPRQVECLRLVWERRTSKEIAAELGLSKGTVDTYIFEAVGILGARNRREAAAMLFDAEGSTTPLPRAAETPEKAPQTKFDLDSAGVSPVPVDAPSAVLSTKASTPIRPWATDDRPLNLMPLWQILGWMVAIAIGSMLLLTLATVIGNGLPAVTGPTLRAFDRLTH
jgi:DNA-binding CsgD family transcriptional regulator